MERVNFQLIEKKWQSKFTSQSLYNKKGKKVLLFRNVPLPIWQNTHGSCT